MFPEPDFDLNYTPCCVEGAYQASAKLKKDGWSVEVKLGESADIQAESNRLFGAEPCWK